MRLVFQRFLRILKVTRRSVEWNLLMNRWIGFRVRMSEKYLKLTLVIPWNLKGISVLSVAVKEIARWEID